MRRLIAAACLCVCLSQHHAVAAEMFGADYAPCGNSGSTLDIVSCVDAATKPWDRRLNTAYGSLLRAADPGQREPLRKAQRLWIQYRDANCLFYGSAEGTIRQIQSAECLRVMTKDRALEFEQALRP